jgi:hypothetical protein
MTTFTTEDRENARPACGCGRSPSGYCVGWHSLSEQDYHKEKELYEYRVQAQNLWFDHNYILGSIGVSIIIQFVN